MGVGVRDQQPELRPDGAVSYNDPAPEEVYRAANVDVTAGRVQDEEGKWVPTILALFHGCWNEDVETNAHVYAYLPRKVAESMHDQLGYILEHYDSIQAAVEAMDD